MASIGAAFLAITSQGNLALHNGYPNPLLTIPMFWILGVGLIIWLPRASPETDENDGIGYSGFVCWLGSFTLVFAVWVAFSQYVFAQSRVIAYPNENCVKETDGERHRWSLMLSPRKMFFENTYKGTTSAYLLAHDANGQFNSHWSFGSMAFIQNETSAFDYGLSFFRTEQKVPPC
jgi:hypothetical protein